jgi:hypothetical protein
MCSAHELGVGANPIPFAPVFIRPALEVFLFFYSDLLGFSRIWSDCPRDGVLAGVTFAGNGSAGRPDIAANLNLFPSCHSSFLASFAVCFITRVSSAEANGRVLTVPNDDLERDCRAAANGPLDTCEPPAIPAPTTDQKMENELSRRNTTLLGTDPFRDRPLYDPL